MSSVSGSSSEAPHSAQKRLKELFVVGTTLPLAWRRTRPVEAALVSSGFWLVPLDGFPYLGFVAVILQFFGLGAHGRPRLAIGLTGGSDEFAYPAAWTVALLAPAAVLVVVALTAPLARRAAAIRVTEALRYE